MRWVIIADDLTGACDTGAVFAQAGLSTRVLLALPGPAEGCDVLAVTTESRRLPAAGAAGAVRRVLEGLPAGAGGQFYYKKIDSTLRGQPAAELAALMDWLGERRALVAPAFPAQGRTVRGGKLLVDGVPLEETVFGREAAAGGLEAAFAGLPLTRLGLEDVRRGAGWLAGRMAGGGVHLADAETDEDLALLAAAARLSGIRLLCGSAGLARAAASVSAAEGGAGGTPLKADFTGGPVLAAAGSRHPATLKQTAAAEQAGIAVERLSWEDLRAGGAPARAAGLARILNEGRSLVLSLDSLPDRPGGEAQAAAGLAELACAALLQADSAEGLVLTGGETAAAVCRALGCRAIDLGGETLPGLGWGRLADGLRPGLPVVTKAGGFGSETALVEAVRFLEKKSEGEG